MDAKETITYLYEHNHIPQTIHLKTILSELEEVARLKSVLHEIAEDAQEISEMIDKALMIT